MGAGTALGLIDNPIAREVHSQHPVLAGSGLKGAIRHNLWAAQPVADKSDKDSKLNRYFGSESQADKPHAGAVSLSDAQLLLFPVRSARNGFVYATSPWLWGGHGACWVIVFPGSFPGWSLVTVGSVRVTRANA